MLNTYTHLFDIPDDICYLNMASQSPSFKEIEQAGIDAVIQKSHPYTITANSYFEPVKELKKLFALLIEATDYNRIASIPSVSYGLATIANNMTLQKDDEILLVEDQFPSNYYVWEKLATKFQATLRIIKRPKTAINQGVLWNKRILDAISDKTALVTIGNIHWASGTLFNLKAIREKTTKHASLLVVDGSQSVGALPFSIKEIRPDALICAGYKWLFGPYGSGYAYYGDYFDDGNPIEENWTNRLHSENMSNLTNYETNYKPLANRYCVGEHASFIHTNMQLAALKQVIEWTPSYIQEYCRNITKEAVLKLQEMGCFIENPAERTHHLFGVKLPKELRLEKLKKELTKAKIFISFRGSYIRLSCHLFNTKKDFDLLIACIKSAMS